MIPDRIYTRPNVIPKCYCSNCGYQLQDKKDERWKFCPMCGKEAEWDLVNEINLHEVNCRVCQKKLVYWKGDVMDASPSFCGSDVCRECRMEHCAQTNCLACRAGKYPNCQWQYLKRLALAGEVEL